MKYVAYRFYILSVVLILLLPIAGCEQEAAFPTSPALSQHAVSVQPAPDDSMNFYVLGTSSDEVGVYVGHEFFMVRIPVGEYLLRYSTNLGTFDLVCKIKENALLFIGLQPDDSVLNAWLFNGTITDIGAETQDHGIVVLYSWPGGPVRWWQVFAYSTAY